MKVSLNNSRILAAVLLGFTVLLSPVGANTNPVIYQQLSHTELGAASIGVVGANLVVSNLGSSGSDGVHVDLPSGTREYRMGWQSLGNATATPTGAYLQGDATAVVNNIPDQPFGFVRITDNGAQLEVTADFSPVGSATARVEVYNGGVLQGSFGGMTGTLATFLVWQDGCWKRSPVFPVLPCYWLPYDLPILITIPGHGSFTGDGLAILADSASATVGTLASFSLRSKDITPVVVNESRATVSDAIPTLSEWGVIGLILLMAASALWMLRRRNATPRTI